MILKNFQDTRSLLILIISIIVQAILILNFKNDQIEAIFWVPLYSFTVFWGSNVNHYHRHNYIFNNYRLNRIVDLILSLIIGAPSTRLHCVHMYNHHQYYKDNRDWSNYKIAAYHKGLNRAIIYILRSSKKIWLNRSDLNLSEKRKNELFFEKIFLWASSVLVLYYSPYAFISLILPSWVIGLSLLLLANLINHDGCDLRSELNHSRDFLNPIENWIFINNGYHTMHHLYPALHWTELPKKHFETFSTQTQKYKENSFFLYLIKNYLVPYNFLSTNKSNRKEKVF